jgi:hypothetical protein
MDPVFARNRLSAYLDGELPTSERAAVADALAEDATLAEALTRLERARERLGGMSDEAAPADLRANLREFVRGRAQAERPLGPTVRRAVHGLVDGVLVVFAVLGVLAAGRAFYAEDTGSPKPRAAGGLPAEPARAPAQPSPETSGSAAPELEALPEDRYAGRPPGTAPHLGRSTRRGTGNPAVPPPAGVALAPAGGGPSERQAYAADWERGLGESGSASADLSLEANEERVLFELEALVRGMGGNLQDGRGKRRAAFVMSPGDRSEVVVMVPTYNLAALLGRLPGLGALETHREPTVSGNPATASVRLSVRLPG